MQRLARLLSLASLFGLTATMGCVEDQELLIVKGTYDLNDVCVLDDSAPLSIDTIDVSIEAPFALGLLVANLQTNNKHSNTGIEDDGEVQLDHAEVSMTFAGAAGGGFELPIPTDSVPSGGELGVILNVPSSVVQAIAPSVAPGDLPLLEMTVVLVGHRTSPAGNGKLGEVRTREYTFPFQLCNGCVTCQTNCGLPQISDCVDE